MKTLTYSLLTSIAVLLLSACTTTLGIIDTEDAGIKYRKNIDALEKEDLDAYVHAVAMLKKKSSDNIYDRTGFLWQAWVHDCPSVEVPENRQHAVDDIALLEGCGLPVSSPSEREHPGMCEHGKDTFFQWHRAEFFFYEKSLQAADPEGRFGPSTKNVTVPYWNFTKKPSGVRYPKVFEIEDSPLFEGSRNRDALETPYSYTSRYLLASMIYNDDWPTFGGYPPGGAGNYGSFESHIHNPMHDQYIGGYLRNPATAGLDPLFYSFHSFIDYIFEKWIEEHGAESITSSRYFMRGEQDGGLPKPVGFSEGSGSKRPGNYTKNMGRGEIYFDTRKQGYAYEAGPGGEFVEKDEIESIEALHRSPGNTHGKSDTSLYSELLSYGAYASVANPAVVFHSEFALPEGTQSVERALIDIVRQSAAGDYSFQADVYIYPATVDADVGRRAFRDRYLAVSANYWALESHHDHDGQMSAGSLVLSPSVTPVINSLLSDSQSSKTWKIAVAISARDYSGDYLFEAPRIEFQLSSND